MKRRQILQALGAVALTGAFGQKAVAGPAGALDLRLVGTWSNEKMINSGGANFASFTTVRTLQFDAGGRVTQWVRSVGGGGNWHYDGGGRRLEFSGRWVVQDGYIQVQPDGSPNFINAGRYHFADRYLVTENGNGRLIWQRA